MAKKTGKKDKDSKKSGKDKEKAGDVQEKQLARMEEISASVEGLRKETAGFAKRLKGIEGEQAKSSEEIKALAKTLKNERVAENSIKRKTPDKDKDKKNAKPGRPGEESEPVITDAARKRAAKEGIDLSGVRGSGVEGRITVGDVEKKVSKSGKGKAARPRKPGKK